MYVARTKIEQLYPRLGLKMLFIHTPKCGGSTVGAAFGRRFRKCISIKHPRLRGHLTWVEYRDRLLDLNTPITDFVTFSVVRNPFEWHLSWFNYLKRQLPRKTGYAIEHDLFQRFSFSDYVHWLDDKDAPRTPRHDMGRQIADWTCDETGKIAVSDVLRQETLVADLGALRDRYGLSLNIPQQRVNAFGTGEDYRRVYSERDVDVIAKRHKRDLALFNYSFSQPESSSPAST